MACIVLQHTPEVSCYVAFRPRQEIQPLTSTAHVEPAVPATSSVASEAARARCTAQARAVLPQRSSTSLLLERAATTAALRLQHSGLPSRQAAGRGDREAARERCALPGARVADVGARAGHPIRRQVRAEEPRPLVPCSGWKGAEPARWCPCFGGRAPTTCRPLVPCQASAAPAAAGSFGSS